MALMRDPFQGAPEYQPEGIDAVIDYANKLRQRTKEYVGERTKDVMIPGPKATQVMSAGPGLAESVDLINPLPGSRTEAALAVVPFGAVMEGVTKGASRMVRRMNIANSWHGLDQAEYIKQILAPRLMNMVAKANKDRVDMLSPWDQARWLSQRITRGVKDQTGKMHWSKDPDELHADIAARLIDRGVPVNEEDVNNLFFKWGDEIVNYEDGSNLEIAFDRYTDLARGTRGGR